MEAYEHSSKECDALLGSISNRLDKSSCSQICQFNDGETYSFMVDIIEQNGLFGLSPSSIQHTENAPEFTCN